MARGGLHIVVESKNNPADMRSGRKKIISDDKNAKMLVLCAPVVHSVGFMQNRGFLGGNLTPIRLSHKYLKKGGICIKNTVQFFAHFTFYDSNDQKIRFTISVYK